MSNFDILRDDVKDLWDKYIRHEFVIKMKEGTLPLDSFKYYMIQDTKYVNIMLKSLLNASSKAPLNKITNILNAIFNTRDKGLEIEKEILEKLNIDDAAIENTGYNLVNYAYTRHLYYNSTIGWDYFLASWAPCMIGYSFVGKFVKGSPNEIYDLWASFYGSKDYENRVETIIDALDDIKLNDGIKNVFRNSVNFEIMFWEAALRKDPTIFK
ncbi:putative transcription activator [Caldisphaera lagunensis DSM 15908]|uniref:Putative transcription activator n=1 Tax=Caldisphaera lagunensis (strain DSM 15908 / JCM 11604 / ANMR 0165 / IC-154) TaxID=1056495 RepID=L0AA92_CALLD|nr:TenA family protein [Caldisphaera lagunensis]AFZ70344.1 putative transcription activator [Caldisphaera lagunensis DSM 15908]